MEATLPIAYALEPDLSAQEFQSILIASTLAERRPATDLDRLRQMLRNADIIVTARDSGCLVGISRAITDFAYCCYLSDLAVDVAYQRQGIGKRLIEETRRSGRMRHAHSGSSPRRRILLSGHRHEAFGKLLDNPALPVSSV